jgi:hypothetical protein
MAPATRARFEHWSQLPAELKLNVLGHLLTQDEEVSLCEHARMMEHDNLGSIIAVRNCELLAPALDACTYY